MRSVAIESGDGSGFMWEEQVAARRWISTVKREIEGMVEDNVVIVKKRLVLILCICVCCVVLLLL